MTTVVAVLGICWLLRDFVIPPLTNGDKNKPRLAHSVIGILAIPLLVYLAWVGRVPTT